MKKAMITSIMTDEVITISINDTLYRAEKVMKRNNIRHIPVVEDDILLGILSLTDLSRLSFVDSFGIEDLPADNTFYEMLSIKQVMISNPITAESNMTIQEVTEILIKHDFHALPVVDGKKLIGIITTTDLLKYLIENIE